MDRVTASAPGSSDTVPGSTPGTVRQVAPAVGIAVAAMVSAQTGAAVFVLLFDRVGTAGAAWLRLCFAAAVLLAWARPRPLSLPLGTLRPALALGGASALMTLCFFAAIDRIPLGTASALEFLGPLALAMAGLRRPVDVVWPLAAVSGVVTLTDPWTSSVDLVGVGFALAAAVGWGAYIVLTQRVADRFAGLDGLALSMTAAAVCATGPGLAGAVGGLDLRVLGISAGAALLLPVVPYALEMTALRRLTTSSFGTLMSVEPAVATAVGFVLLAQGPSAAQLAGIALVVAAGLGAARGGRRPARPACDVQA